MKFLLHRMSLYTVIVLYLTACSAARRGAHKDDRKIDVVFVLVNDVYEIEPLAGGKEGGVARVATLKKRYQQTNTNTFLVIAGDFISPSVYNSLQYEGKRIRGKQMIEAMNAAGMDLAVFGNHEFDVNESELQERINESAFQWVASNAFHKQNGSVTPFTKTTTRTPFPKYIIKTVTDADGTTARIGFIGLTLPVNNPGYVSYTDPLTAAQELYAQIKDSADAVVAVTHQAMEDDVKLAQAVPGLALILGGHEHDMRRAKEGTVHITKAHANAKSAFAVKMNINKKRKRIAVEPELVYVNESIPPDSATNAVVQKWSDIAGKSFGSLGFDAKKVVLSTGDPLDGRESEVRNRSTGLTKLVAAAVAHAAPEAEVAFYNAGLIRVDDIMHPPLTQYDVIRALPFGGGIREADMKGSLLIKILEQGRKNQGVGGFLHYNEAVTYDAGTSSWKLKGTAIDPAKIYRVAITEFLFSGRETNLEFLVPSNLDIVKVYDAETSVSSSKSDVRLAVVRYLESINK